jgi:hypothetical protein
MTYTERQIISAARNACKFLRLLTAVERHEEQIKVYEQLKCALDEFELARTHPELGYYIEQRFSLPEQKGGE